MHFLPHHDQWLEHDGKIVLLDGIKHRLRVFTWNAIYPYPHRSISVQAEPVNRDTAYYREIKADLGDHWSTDVLDSDAAVTAAILAQLESALPPVPACGPQQAVSANPDTGPARGF